jgi:hypothetical protein
MPKAEALTSKLRREAFQDEIAVVMTASLRSAVIKGCMPAVAYANKGLKIFEKGLADELFSQGAVPRFHDSWQRDAERRWRE